ncbi:hypothetical protein ACFQAT_28100 [Undibacterium arcticum]|uniref:hypothetical protein n=1 Tax=Undibacterium arcticum TaxID=1762892 RepID=UPI0036110881
MSKTLSARDAIKAEIEHFTKGRDHYQVQLDKLVKALAALDGIDGASPKFQSDQRTTKTRVTQDVKAPAKKWGHSRFRRLEAISGSN